MVLGAAPAISKTASGGPELCGPRGRRRRPPRDAVAPVFRVATTDDESSSLFLLPVGDVVAHLVQRVLRHSARRRALNASVEAVSVGFPGLARSNSARFR